MSNKNNNDVNAIPGAMPVLTGEGARKFLEDMNKPLTEEEQIEKEKRRQKFKEYGKMFSHSNEIDYQDFLKIFKLLEVVDQSQVDFDLNEFKEKIIKIYQRKF